tara:strand:+ start:2326 stop:2661 length:336 start_codon:yes stop_codon:yes gene_type:complete
MADKLKDNYKGHGSMKAVTDQWNAVFKALNEASVQMPGGYKGEIPTFSIQDGALILDMKDAQVFSPTNVKWNLLDAATQANPAASDSVAFDSYSLSVVNGYLTINVTVSAV